MFLPVKTTIYRTGEIKEEIADVTLTREHWRIFCEILDCQRACTERLAQEEVLLHA